MAAQKTKKFSFGTCSFNRTSPPQKLLSPQTRVLNIVISFEDALKLNLAVSECVRKLNSYNRSFRAGKNAALNLALHIDKGRISINEVQL